MPWHVSDGPDNRCPKDKPWAVILDSDGSAVQCHISKERAQKAVAALYINVTEKGKTMNKMVRDAEFKALTAEGFAPGTFSAVVAVYGNVDRMGDRIIEGAFDDTLNDWKRKNEPIPLILAHEWNNPFAHIGYVMPEHVKSVPGVGLVVEEGHLDVDDNPMAAQVYRLMERKSLAQFSFGYTIPAGGGAKALDGAFDLKKLNLVEIGPCLRGVNDQTQLLSIKSELEAQERGMSVEERLARLEAEIEVKADGPPQAAYDPQSAVKSMLVTGNSFVTKVNEQAAIDAMKTVIADLGKVPGATPKPEFAGTKALLQVDSPRAHPDTVASAQYVNEAAATPEADTPAEEYDQLRVLNSMIAQAQEFIDNESEAEYVTQMQSVVQMLQALVVTEGQDVVDMPMAAAKSVTERLDKMVKEEEELIAAALPTKKPVPAPETKSEPEPDAPLDAERMLRELSTIQVESALHNREVALNDVLEGGKSDSTLRKLDDLEKYLKEK